MSETKRVLHSLNINYRNIEKALYEKFPDLNDIQYNEGANLDGQENNFTLVMGINNLKSVLGRDYKLEITFMEREPGWINFYDATDRSHSLTFIQGPQADNENWHYEYNEEEGVMFKQEEIEKLGVIGFDVMWFIYDSIQK